MAKQWCRTFSDVHPTDHEVETNFDENGDPSQLLADCEKNPGHVEFIFAKKFGMKHLPPGFREKGIFNLFKALMSLVVLVVSSSTSFKRPKHDPFYAYRGKNNSRNGSGWVWRVTKHTKREGKRCQCGMDQNVDSSSKHETPIADGATTPCDHEEWAEIGIVTAAHVVYDDTEAEKTTCYFFHDDDEVPLKGRVRICGLSVENTDAKRDVCIMKYITHDMKFANILEEKWNHYASMCEKVWDDHYDPREKCLNFPNDVTLCVVVSHPHGSSKKLTIGILTGRHHIDNHKAEIDNGKEVAGELIQYNYSAATCRGSSGAPVFTLGRKWWWWRGDMGKEWKWGSGRWIFCHPHTGCPKNNNTSAVHWEPTPPATTYFGKTRRKLTKSKLKTSLDTYTRRRRRRKKHASMFEVKG